MLIDQQTARVATTHPTVGVRRIGDGTSIVTFQSCLVPGWNKQMTQVSFVLPVPYPAAQPDCFYADVDLRLVDGAMPANSGIQPLNGIPMLWFSWHLAAWAPQRDDIATYIRFVESRLHDPR